MWSVKDQTNSHRIRTARDPLRAIRSGGGGGQAARAEDDWREGGRARRVLPMSYYDSDITTVRRLRFPCSRFSFYSYYCSSCVVPDL